MRKHWVLIAGLGLIGFAVGAYYAFALLVLCAAGHCPSIFN